MDVIGKMMGWDWKVRKVRRRWDRLREKSLEKKGRFRHTLLKMLDDIENKVRILEEERLSKRDRKRILAEVTGELEKIKYMIEKDYEPVERGYPDSGYPSYKRRPILL
jgi:hypothetical protein